MAHITTAHTSNDNRILHKECAALAAAGLEVYLIAGDSEPLGYRTRNVNVIPLPQRRRRIIRMLIGPWDAWRVLVGLSPAMIHVHDPELIPLAIIWKIIKRRPAVFDSHEDLAKQIAGKSYIPRRARLLVIVMAHFLEHCADYFLDGIVAATPAIARNYRRAPVTLVQNFPWLGDFHESDAANQPEPFSLIYVGGITRERGGFEMLDAVRNSKFVRSLTLAGLATAEMREALHSVKNDDRIRYLGILPVRQIPAVISASQIGLIVFHPLPNHLECQPTKIFEYMASARPFIASDFDYWRDLLGRFDCGLFVDPLDAGSVQRAIDKLLSDPTLATEMGKRGRLALVTNFTFDQEALSLIGMTQSLVTHFRG